MVGTAESTETSPPLRAQLAAGLENDSDGRFEAPDPTARRRRLQIDRAEEGRRLAWRVVDNLAVGVILLDATCRIREMNESARALLRSADGLELGRDETLRAARPADTRRLAKLVAHAAAGGGRQADGALSLPRPSDLRPLQLLVAPLGRVPARARAGGSRSRWVVVYVSDPERELRLCPESVQRIFDLTPTEACVACELAYGASTNEVAVRTGMGPSTVRWHLKRIYAKTGTRRQTELVRAVLTSPLVLRS
jgi:DNA-binding CsgD family transcriptional regulator